jgi:hypothetical protein
VFDEHGGFDEHFATHYQDVDPCLRPAAGLRLCTPRAVLRHTSAPRRYTTTRPRAPARGLGTTIARGDPYYSPLLLSEPTTGRGWRMNVALRQLPGLHEQQRDPIFNLANELVGLGATCAVGVPAIPPRSS